MKIFVDQLAHCYKEDPIVLVDIGASGGLSPHWRSAEPYLKLIAFEPDARAFEQIKDRNNTKTLYLNTGLLDAKKTVNLYMTRKQQASSVFKPNVAFLKNFPEAERFDVLHTVPMAVDTLDNQLRSNNIESVDFLKIDTQGSELMVLEGARETLKGAVFGCELEVEFSPLYEGQPLFPQVDTLMREFGFQLFDLQRFGWKRKMGMDVGNRKGQLTFANALYFRGPEDFLAKLASIAEPRKRKSKALNAISICILYGYFDYAREILECTRGNFSAEEVVFVERRIARGILYDGYSEQARAFIRNCLGGAQRPGNKGAWAFCDRRIGNV